MLIHLLDMLHGLLQLLVALIPLAIWQRTQIGGFLLIAASYALSTLLSWAGAWVFSMPHEGSIEGLLLGWRVLGLAILGVGAFGFWQAYTALKRQWPAVPKT